MDQCQMTLRAEVEATMAFTIVASCACLETVKLMRKVRLKISVR